MQGVAFRGHVYQIKTEQVGENNSRRRLETIFHADESGDLDEDFSRTYLEVSNDTPGELTP